MQRWIAVAVGAMALTGCGADEPAPERTTPAAAPKPAAARVSFVEPANGATVGSTVTARIKLANFEIDPDGVGKAPAPGKGHLHFAMDGGKYDFPRYSGPNGRIAKSLGVAGKYSPAATTEITYRGLPPGKHSLEVYLANNNHTETGVETTITFTVK
jgi:hypothetical protein